MIFLRFGILKRFHTITYGKFILICCTPTDTCEVWILNSLFYRVYLLLVYQATSLWWCDVLVSHWRQLIEVFLFPIALYGGSYHCYFCWPCVCKSLLIHSLFAIYNLLEHPKFVIFHWWHLLNSVILFMSHSPSSTSNSFVQNDGLPATNECFSDCARSVPKPPHNLSEAEGTSPSNRNPSTVATFSRALILGLGDKCIAVNNNDASQSPLPDEQ